MAGKSLNELVIKDEAAALPALDYESMPEFGSFAPPPQPGTYRFETPGDLTKVFDVYEKDGKQYLRVIFDKDAPLTIVQAKNPALVGESFQTRLSNQTRPRGKDKIEISDLDLLLRALGVKQRPQGIRATIDVVKAQLKKQFTADINYSWVCAEDRDIRVDDGQGSVKVVEGTKGCGKKYYQADKTNKAEQKVDRQAPAEGQAQGEYPYEIVCACGNVLRAFANLDNIRA